MGPADANLLARVWDRRLYDEQKPAGVPAEDAELVFWTGGYDRASTTPERLVEIIQPFACVHGRADLLRELLSDQANDDSRSYTLCEEPDDGQPDTTGGAPPFTFPP